MKRENENEISSPLPLRWLEILASAASLIGIAGLIALISQGSWAADGSGFQPGPKGFSNPFAGQTAPKNNYFEDEDDEDEPDFPEDQVFVPPTGNNQGNIARNQPQGGAPQGGGAQGGGNQNGVSVGGGTAGGVVQGSTLEPLKVDTETAAGCKEIVTDFNFPDADIMDIAKALGKLVGKNFIYDKDVKGRISIISNGPITCGDAWKAFLTALDINGYALIPSGKYIRIARQRDARDKQLKTYVGESSPDTDALITRLFPLKYLSAEEVARNFRSFMPANSRIIPYEQTNTVIVTDTGSNIAKLAKLLEILDIEGYDAGIEVIAVKYASAVELAKLIDTLVPGTSTGPAGAPRFGGARGSAFSARRTKEGGIINTIISDERTNTLIVHANSKGADQIRELVKKLDQKLPSTAGGGKVHVVYLQFAEAEQIANTLNNLSSQAATRPAGPTGGTGVNPVQASLFEGSIRVSPDKATNSLVVTASAGDFVTVQRVINRLDIPRDQVYAEIVIMEVALGRNFNFSTNIASPANGIAFTPNTDLLDFVTNPLSARGATLGIPIGGKKNFTIGGTSYPIASVQGLIRALQVKSNANVLATPQILALDNTEASFESSEKIPVPVTTAVQGAGTQSSVTKENVSLKVTIKPQINKVANFVKLDVQAQLEDFSGRELPAQVAQLALATVSRNAKTSIVVADKDTVVLGGLTRDDSQEQVSKIPILGDIPLLGWLFKSKKQEVTKKNLLIFITPNIVRQYETVRAILDRKLKERDEFLETSTGGEDPQRPYRDELIRNLPDIKKVVEDKPARVVSLDDDGATPAQNKGGMFAPPVNNQPSGAKPSTNGNTGTPSTTTAPPGGQVPQVGAPQGEGVPAIPQDPIFMDPGAAPPPQEFIPQELPPPPNG